MKNIPKDLKEELNQKLPIDIANIINIEKSVESIYLK
jgi:hypothetical protein